MFKKFKSRYVKGIELKNRNLGTILMNIAYMENASAEMIRQYAKDMINEINNTDYTNKFTR